MMPGTLAIGECITTFGTVQSRVPKCETDVTSATYCAILSPNFMAPKNSRVRLRVVAATHRVTNTASSDSDDYILASS